YYMGIYNQFLILSAFVNDKTFSLDMSEEQRLARLGEIIGHELTHGFDPNGIKYDKDGNLVADDNNPNGWMPAADYEAYMKRAEKVADYFNSIIPVPYGRCDGTAMWGEASADIGGMSIALKIAEDIDGFDYDEFFRNHSILWRQQSTLISDRYDYTNEHPLSHLRINVTNQQFDEFYDTYDIKEVDLMYLAPENRIKIW
ncbi:MAG: hypothetical protein K5870_07620, partial [Lachnospiraceae bacterium]|nr:hypothetical protein [Lachnospiraceae bacterium]